MNSNTLAHKLNQRLFYNTYGVYAVNSKTEANALFVNLGSINSESLFNKVYTDITKHFKQIYGESFILSYRKRPDNKPLYDGIYIFYWTNDLEHYEALKYNFTIEMEQLLAIQKLVLAKKQKLVELSKDMLKYKPKD